MQSITIKANTLAREAGYLAACFLVAVAANVYAIIAFHRPFTEFFSQIGFVVVISLVLYAYTGILRLIYHAVIYFINKIRVFIKKHKSKS